MRNRSQDWKRDFQLQNSLDFARGKRNEPVCCDGIKYLHLQNAENYSLGPLAKPWGVSRSWFWLKKPSGPKECDPCLGTQSQAPQLKQRHSARALGCYSPGASLFGPGNEEKGCWGSPMATSASGIQVQPKSMSKLIPQPRAALRISAYDPCGTGRTHAGFHLPFLTSCWPEIMFYFFP